MNRVIFAKSVYYYLYGLWFLVHLPIWGVMIFFLIIKGHEHFLDYFGGHQIFSHFFRGHEIYKRVGKNPYRPPETSINEHSLAFWSCFYFIGFKCWLMFMFPCEHKYACNKFHSWDFVPWVGSCLVLFVFLWSTKMHNKKVPSGDLWSLESVRARDRQSRWSRSSAFLVAGIIW